MTHWEDRLTEKQHQLAEEALKEFRKIPCPKKEDEHVLFNALIDCGLNSEEADEMIDLELSDQ